MKANIVGVDHHIVDSIFHEYYLPKDYANYVPNKSISEKTWKIDGISPIFEKPELETVEFDAHSIISNSHFYPKKSFSYKTRRVVLPVG